MADRQEGEAYHPEEERPRKEVEVESVSAKADAEAVTNPIAGESEPRRWGLVKFKIDVTVECLCGNEVTVGDIQRTVICQDCRREWRLR